MNRFVTVIAAGAFLLTGLGLAQAQQGSNDELRDTFGDWEIRCIKGTDTCAMSQIGNTKEGERALLVTIQRVTGAKTEDGRPIEAAMTVQAPLGILIPYGIRIKIDGDKVVPLPLSRCIPQGCVSQAPMLDEAVKNMKKGSKAVYGIFLEQEILVDISLSGFTKAYNNLKPVAGQ
ncbi:MAG: invasion associated locus B family protein [Pseudomonadota bacterium]